MNYQLPYTNGMNEAEYQRVVTKALGHVPVLRRKYRKVMNSRYSASSVSTGVVKKRNKGGKKSECSHYGICSCNN
jgi:hypothetical protein